jgi:hypothetical protein
MRDHDLRLLQEAYSEIIYNQNILLSEGFFQELGAKLAAKLKGFAPYIIAGAGAGSILAPVAPLVLDPYKKSAAKHSVIQRQVSQQDEKKYGDTFRDETRAHAFMSKTDKFEITPRQFFASLYGDKWNDILQNARKNQQNRKDVKFSMNLDDNYLDQNYTIKVCNGNEDSYLKARPTVHGYCDHMGNIVIAKDRVYDFLNTLSHELRHAVQPYVSFYNSSVSPGAKGVSEYVGNTHETGARIAELMKQYWEDHARDMRYIPSSPEEVKKMLEYYGIYEDGVRGSNTRKLPFDVEQIFYMLKMMEKRPHIYKKYYDALCDQIPGLVQQTNAAIRSVA